MPADSRDRVTVDLRGAGNVVHARARAQGLTVAAFVRRAVLTMAEGTVDATDSTTVAASADDGQSRKVTLRLPAPHAVLLTMRARAADVSQGSYIAGLIDGAPPPRVAPDHRQAIATLARSTDQLAILSTDINALMRLLRMGSVEQARVYRDRLDSLSSVVHGHLDVASRFLADLQQASPARAGRRPSRRRP
jgi:hypothetical protein